ncbi:adenylosuccinate lyase [Mycobacteroides abscessus subsp. abscessus]|nr:adenylosuccinate lyase [Mycobacteroides abscessus subsp. abscessus]
MHAHGVAVVARLARHAVEYRDVVMAGRSHNVAAQATTLGKRFASAADETLLALTRLRELLDRYPLRGIKGPMGTGQDMLDLCNCRFAARWSTCMPMASRWWRGSRVTPSSTGTW